MPPVANSRRTKFQVSDRVAANTLSQVLRDALTGPNHRGAPEVVWEDRGSQVLLHVGRLQVRTLDAAVVVAVDVETAEFGESQLIVRFVFGKGRDPATFVASSDERVGGRPLVAARWGTHLYRNVIWAALMRMVETHADEREMRPGRITVGKDQIRLTAEPPLPLPLAELAALHRLRLSADEERLTDERGQENATGAGRGIMTLSLGALGEFTELAKAIGLLDASGDFDVTWFLRTADPPRRGGEDRQPTTSLHPVLRPLPPGHGGTGSAREREVAPTARRDPNGNLYLTLKDTGSGLVLGVAGDFHGSGRAGQRSHPRASRRHQCRAAPSISSSARLLTHSPSRCAVRDWVDRPRRTPATPSASARSVAKAEIVPDPIDPSIRLEVILEQLSLAGEPPVDKVLDVAQLGRDVPDVLAALLQVVLARAFVDPTVASSRTTSWRSSGSPTPMPSRPSRLPTWATDQSRCSAG